MGGINISASPQLELEDFWGRAAAKTLFHKKKIELAMHFDTFWWTVYKWAMAGYPKTFQTFITKQVFGWCGCNSKL
jgi:hypothetical protein